MGENVDFGIRGGRYGGAQPPSEGNDLARPEADVNSATTDSFHLQLRVDPSQAFIRST